MEWKRRPSIIIEKIYEDNHGHFKVDFEEVSLSELDEKMNSAANTIFGDYKNLTVSSYPVEIFKKDVNIPYESGIINSLEIAFERDGPVVFFSYGGTQDESEWTSNFFFTEGMPVSQLSRETDWSNQRFHAPQEVSMELHEIAQQRPDLEQVLENSLAYLKALNITSSLT